MGNMKLNPEETRAFIARMDKDLMPVFKKCVLPIYAHYKDGLVQCGTGTLFRVADRSFLVSASHVTDLGAKRGIQLYITNSVPGSSEVALEGALHSERNLDVSVWELPSTVVNALPDREFLSIHRADRADLRITPGWYHIHGYPNCWSDPRPDERKIVVKPFTYGTILYSGDTTSFAGYDSRIHILLEVTKQRNVDSEGAETEMPHSLRGISGCSIWQSYYQGLPSKQWTADDAIVVAVQTGVYQNGAVVRGTRWWVIEQIISKNYPDLRGPMEIVTPYKRG